MDRIVPGRRAPVFARAGLVHMDIKPSNVLITMDGQPMLLDFHLARGPILAGERGCSAGSAGRRAGCRPSKSRRWPPSGRAGRFRWPSTGDPTSSRWASCSARPSACVTPARDGVDSRPPGGPGRGRERRPPGHRQEMPGTEAGRSLRRSRDPGRGSPSRAERSSAPRRAQSKRPRALAEVAATPPRRARLGRRRRS